MKKDTSLPVRMYAHGLGFRVHLRDGRKVNLGRDRVSALIKYAQLMGPVEDPALVSNAKQMWARHKKGAAARKLPFDLTVEDVERALVKSEGRCAITSLPFSDVKPQGLRIRPWMPSIDRIRTDEGYVPGNIRIVCGFVNVALNGFGGHLFDVVLKRLIDAGVKAELTRLGVSISHEASNPSHCYNIGSNGAL
ncbi:MAG: hypothetical protein KKH21_07765 [Gammaproteobacteria bacterium]|nr:hypothetical protein [Gammaproteobacteria bacterium]MBU0890773.1 hypothetical protein [Gammaproteobacteria bacterium]